jgi:hypothetical protein
MSGAEVLSDDGYIAGTEIPIVPIYGNREYIDNVERFKGHVHDKIDSQRAYNAKVSRLHELDSTSPRQRPIFTPEQMPPELRDLWALGDVDRHGYALVNPLIDPATGQIIHAGPIGMIEPIQLPPVTAALIQQSNMDLIEDDQDSSDTVKANVSEEAMNLAATRIDAKSGIYLDNIRQSEQRAGEIYESMCADVYWEEGRKVPTMDEDDGDGEAVLHEAYTDKSGIYSKRNDFTRGKYKVIVSVSEATATRRDKAVRAALNTAEIAGKMGDTELGQAALLTAIMNQDGEGLDSLKKFARRKAVALGLEEPNEEEKVALAREAENAQQQPDPNAELVKAQGVALQAGAAKDMKTIEKMDAEIDLLDVKARATAAGVMIEARHIDSPNVAPLK